MQLIAPVQKLKIVNGNHFKFPQINAIQSKIINNLSNTDNNASVIKC